MDRAPTPTPAPARAGFDHPEEQIQRSLFGEILDWMLVPLLLLWPISIAITYVVAKNIANQPFDRALDDRVTVLAQQVKEVDGRLTVPLPASTRDMLRADDVDNVYYQVRAPDGSVVDGDREVLRGILRGALRHDPGRSIVDQEIRMDRRPASTWPT